MADENAARFEQMEQTTQELKEMLLKNQEEHREQMANLMEMVLQLTKGKATTESPIPTEVATGSRTVQEEPLCPLGSTPIHMQPSQERCPLPNIMPPPAQITQETGPIPSPPAGASTFPHVIPSMGQAHESGQYGINPGTSSINPMLVHDPEEPKEQEGSKKELVVHVESTEAQQKYKLLEERLKAIEGLSVSKGMGAVELTLVPDLVLPHKFKTPEFEKFNGGTCPAVHLTMYCRKMTGYTNNDKLLIHCFQDSLTGAAARWYMQLSRSHIRSWDDLANAFLAQYKHMVDEAPDRMALLNIEKKAIESFREYAQRWRDFASQVQPPMTEKETAKIFVNSLKGIYHNKMLGNATKNFADMVVFGEIIESSIKNGLVEDSSSSKKTGSGKKKEGEAQAVYGEFQPNYVPYSFYPGYAPYYPSINNVAHNPYVYQPSKPVVSPTLALNTAYATQPQQSNQFGNRNDNRVSRPKPQFDPIPCTYTELFPQLVAKDMIRPVQIPPLQPPYPKWYNSNAHCDYHSGAAGHTLENCVALKYKVRDLIKKGELSFEITDEPNVNANPLPNHVGAK